MALSQLEVTGAEVYATDLGSALGKRGHCITYVSDTLTRKIQGTYIPLRFNKRSPIRRIWHIVKLIYIIYRYQIQLVHAHSRAAGWSAYIACKITRTPMVTTVHGRQPVHQSRKKFHAFGYAAIAVCEEIQRQLTEVLGVPPENTRTIRNGIDTTIFNGKFDCVKINQSVREGLRISIIGRLTGPKGELAYRLLSEAIDLDKVSVEIITGSKIPERFKKFQNKVQFTGYQEDIRPVLENSRLIIGAGRVAAEALLYGVPTFAIGEAKAIGLITEQNLDIALQSNFGDIGEHELDIDFSALRSALTEALSPPPVSPIVQSRIKEEFSLEKIATRIENLYQSAVVYTLKREMPILMYHRFIADESEKGIHGTWIPVEMFEKHLKLIKRLGFETLTFRDIAQNGFIHRLKPGKKFLMITADDGYQDNLTRMLPLLEKYDMKATVYVVSNETHNRWDTEHPTNPDAKVPLLSADEIRILDKSGRVEIGGHTLSHAKLDEIPEAEQRREIVENKRALEGILCHPILSFAYPFGNLNDSAKRQAIAAGYQFAVATDSGPKAMHQDAFQIRRINVFPRTTVFGLWRKIRGNYVWRR